MGHLMRVVEQLLHWDKRDEARSVNEALGASSHPCTATFDVDL